MTRDYIDAAVARSYDADHGGTDPRMPRQTIDCLLDLAQGGDVLEFAVGTGRIALPLIARGAVV